MVGKSESLPIKIPTSGEEEVDMKIKWLRMSEN